MPPSESAFIEARLQKQQGLFEPLHIDGSVPLSSASLPESTELLCFEKDSRIYALRVDVMGWHHVAQGSMQHTPYVVAFCGVCNSACGLTPIADGRTLTLEVRPSFGTCYSCQLQ